MKQPYWLNVTDYADTYGVDRATVYKWMEAGMLDYFRVLRVIRIKNQPPRETAAYHTNVD